MATAIVSGTSSGIGEAIAQMLLDNGYKVIGLSRSEGSLNHPNFIHIACDLRHIHEIEVLKTLESNDLKLLINAAGFGRFEPHEELSLSTITDMIALNLTAPIVLSNLFLRTLKANQGKIINITSIEATRSSKFSALYSATKSGLRAFGHSLFEEVRASGVGVLTINPDMTDTPFFDDLRFGVGESEESKLFASDIAKSLLNLLSMRDGMCTTELTLRPQRFGITKKH
ncbi:MAG: SDR family NAD(P)-dependent oxidoreductase [Sulfuricurvum sp.]|uniref:SDR family oxidoreductase n=1 Tax=Sulfuricurvum sp. TaxID=2025608 RepID=UPI0026124749|nr:SDR family NAD(P)-dependent oxidoreductase [Sulfuricurvum sp.]MDD2830170.1 SDR family NAD(P)-dependent oxidoreductase [Sulfuricurvum sp.]MDD4949234.1 SDR family NAD(P)-dependent oxidoreductase [Sulfuricurvum sp.]